MQYFRQRYVPKLERKIGEANLLKILCFSSYKLNFMPIKAELFCLIRTTRFRQNFAYMLNKTKVERCLIKRKQI